MSKRSSPDSESNQSGGRDSPVGPATKRQRRVIFEPVRMKAMGSVVEQDTHTLAFQNFKLSERLVHRQRLETELRRRIEQLEKRQTQDDAMLCIINRHWNRLDEDVRILLQRFDAETAVEHEVENEATATSAFLAQLSQWDNEEIEGNLAQRVEFSRRAIAKLVQVFDRLNQRNDRITQLIQKQLPKDETEDTKKEPTEVTVKQEPETETKPDVKNIEEEISSLSEEVVKRNAELQHENHRLQSLITRCQSKNHELSMKKSTWEDQLMAAETRTEELRNKIEDSNFEIHKLMLREDNLDYRLAEVVRERQNVEMQLAQAKQTGDQQGNNSFAQVSKTKLDELTAALEDQRELATNRLTELQDLNDQHRNALQEIERLTMHLNHLPSDVITNSTEYKCLQSQFSVLYQESAKIKQHIDHYRNQVIKLKAAYLKQIEKMESEELLAQRTLRSEMLQLEDQLSQVRREYEMLRLEFEQNLAANEQTGPINREMRQLLASYKTQNQQLKQEANRFKKKWKEAVSQMCRVQKELDQEKKIKDNSIVIELPIAELESALSPDKQETKSDKERAATPDSDPEEGEIEEGNSNESDVEKLQRQVTRLKSRVSELKEQLAAFKALECEERDKATLLARERRLGVENDRLRTEVQRLNSQHRKDRPEDMVKRLRHTEDQCEKLKKEATNSKQEEDTLLNEMEVTGQAFEEMQEQNTRLLQQLKEKDDANFKLMSERIRSNQQHKKLKEEKDLVEEQVGALQNQVEAQNLVVRKLEEKERLLHHHNNQQEKELNMKQQSLELNKRKAMEHAQSAADLKLQLEKLTSQLYEAQQAVAAKTGSIEEESFKMRRLQEEISTLRKRVERAKKLENVERADEVLLEEIKELKEQLTCPSCKVNRKDAILSKCHHVFCMDCLKTRYETRRRKCPKCNATFGANDYRRIYIS